MKDIQSALKQRLAQKHMAKISIGAFLVRQAKKFVQHPSTMTGYCRNNILFLKLDVREDKPKIFMQKKTILDALHDALKAYAYTYKLQDIRLK